MADKKLPPQEQPANPVAFVDTAHAPVIYFDAAPTFGFRNGVGNITLAAARHVPAPDGKIQTDGVIVAHLRFSAQAALGLQHAINSALLLAAPSGGESGQSH